MKTKYIVFLSLLSIIFYVKCNDVIRHIAPVYDEPLHLMQGYTYLKTGSMQVVSPFDQPMLAKIIPSIPLLFLKPQLLVFTTHDFYYNKQRYPFANLMFYYNNHDAEKVLSIGRKTNIIVSIVFLWILFYITKKLLVNKTQFLCLYYTYLIQLLQHILVL